MAAKRTAKSSRIRAPKRRSITGVTIGPEARLALYAAGRSLPASLEKIGDLHLPITIYFQDPLVAADDPAMGLVGPLSVRWEPGLGNGPTSSRFAVVDYNGDNGVLEAPATWDPTADRFVGRDGKPLIPAKSANLQFHQVNVWAILQHALEYFEDAAALGRPIPWAFEGNRLIVVPHAGYGENAYYDRDSKSLQFYYCGSDDTPVYTCLSADVVRHEFGHAVLDGVRPFLQDSIHPQTGAFHEFVGDLTAILLALSHKPLRDHLAAASGGNLAKAESLKAIAEEFGQAVNGQPYLRRADNDKRLSDLLDETSVHDLSEVLTGAMFDILVRFGERDRKGRTAKRKTVLQAFWDAAARMRRTAIQPLDLLPPVDVTFRDYALAMCRTQQLAEPLDPNRYLDSIIDAFVKRTILSKKDADELRTLTYLYDRLPLDVSHSINDMSRSRAAAYRFLDDNRQSLLIPANRDFVVADLYDTRKSMRENQMMPRQIVVQYVWREEVALTGRRFGKYEGRTTTMSCGGTLVFNENGNVLSWMMKPGSEPFGGAWASEGVQAEKWRRGVAEGRARRREFLDQLAERIESGQVGRMIGSARGVLGSYVPPVLVDDDGSMLRFRLSPHLHLARGQDVANDKAKGERRWQISF